MSQGRKKLSDSHKDFLVISCIIETFYVYCGMIILSKKQGASGTFSHRCENLRVTTIDSQGRASVRFQWANSFNELVEQLLERFHTGVKIHRQTESCIKYSIGSWTKEIEVV